MAEPRTATGRSLNDMQRLHVADCPKSQRRSGIECVCNIAGDILAIEREAFEGGRTEGYWQGVRDGQHKSLTATPPSKKVGQAA